MRAYESYENTKRACAGLRSFHFYVINDYGMFPSVGVTYVFVM